ncbi:hypothetical protein BZK40_15610 [Citrobacter portucalensis]|nr:hypothetical protein BZK40_15610 [Citrobacter portucalensis]
MKFNFYCYIPVILQAACALATFVHLSHIVIYAPGNSLTCRLHATRIILVIALASIIYCYYVLVIN